jgi:hypothetical protein
VTKSGALLAGVKSPTGSLSGSGSWPLAIWLIWSSSVFAGCAVCGGTVFGKGVEDSDERADDVDAVSVGVDFDFGSCGCGGPGWGFADAGLLRPLFCEYCCLSAMCDCSLAGGG